MSTSGDDPKDLRVSNVPRSGPAAASDGVSETMPASAATQAESVGGVGDTAEIAQALGAGTLDPETAKAQLIEQAVAAQIPDGASPELVAEIRAEVTELLESDPVLEQLLSP